MRTLIAYFSRAGENYFGGAYRYIDVGNTQVVAGQIQALTGADIFQIEMKTPYAQDYATCIREAKRDLQANARPALTGRLDSIGQYDTIILGYPNYWGTIPMAVFTFLEGYDFTGKTILPFCTNEGSGLGRSEEDLKAACPGARVLPGLALRGSAVAQADDAIKSWLASIDAR